MGAMGFRFLPWVGVKPLINDSKTIGPPDVNLALQNKKALGMRGACRDPAVSTKSSYLTLGHEVFVETVWSSRAPWIISGVNFLGLKNWDWHVGPKISAVLIVWDRYLGLEPKYHQR